MKLIFTLVLFILTIKVHSQVVEISTEITESLAGEIKPEFFTKGLLDYGFQGQVQATTQAVKIHIGEPAKFYMPLYLLVGATNGDFGASELNKGTILSLINPTGGLLNLSTNINQTLFKSSSGITNIKFTAFAGGKVLTGRSQSSNETLTKLAAFADGGLTAQTGAWDANGSYSEGGIAWMQIKYAYMHMSKDDLRSYFGDEVKSVPHGLRIEAGIYVQDRVNIKVSFYKSTNSTNIPTLDKGQFRLALDYTVSKK